MASITPRGMTVTEAYRNYREGKFIINRAYQRKLVWTVDEKRKLIDSILLGYPIPLILLAQTKEGNYEVIDGMQRLNAIFDFIDNSYSLEGKGYFDIMEFGTARQALSDGVISHGGLEKLTPKECSDITEYQLAVTIFPIEDESDVTDIFGRINSGGKHLSAQEKRQAGVISPFSTLVRKIATEIRGDASEDLLKLYEMPKISIEGRQANSKLGYGINATETFWVSQGILNTKELRDSVDEQIIADLTLSIIERKPFAASKDAFDDVYDINSDNYRKINSSVTAYSEGRIVDEITTVISVFKDIMSSSINHDLNTFKTVIYNGKASNSARSAFYTLFMALHELIIRESKAPSNNLKIIQAITGLNKNIQADTKHVRSDGRAKNVALTKGLIQQNFYDSSPSLLNHGTGLIMSFENDLRRSKIESQKFEFKQGFLTLHGECPMNVKLLDKLVEIACSMGNIGKMRDHPASIYIGISDKPQDSVRITEFFDVSPIRFEEKDIFGIEHEAKHLNILTEDYIKKIIQLSLIHI